MNRESKTTNATLAALTIATVSGTNSDSELALRLARNGRRDSISVDSTRRSAESRGGAQVAMNTRLAAEHSAGTASWRGVRAA